MLNTLENKILFAVALVLGLYMTHAGAESNEIIPPKKPSVIEQKLTSAKMWAIGFGADVKKQQIENLKTTKQALKQDWSWSEGGRLTYRLKNEWEDIKAYQRQQNKKGREQLENNKAQLKGYWQTVAEALGKLGLKPVEAK